MNVYLIGYRCCGKTSLGSLLAERLGWSSVDTDEQVVDAAGQEIAAIVNSEGWGSFRRMERFCLAAAADRKGLVVATGGGVVLDPQNVSAMKKSGVVVWLTASADVIRHRMRRDDLTAKQRPSLTNNGASSEIESVLEERTPLYRAASDIELDTDRESISVLVENLMIRLRRMGVEPREGFDT